LNDFDELTLLRLNLKSEIHLLYFPRFYKLAQSYMPWKSKKR